MNKLILIVYIFVKKLLFNLLLSFLFFNYTKIFNLNFDILR